MEKHGENSMDSLDNHGAWSWSKIPWCSWGNYHANSMLAWNRKIVTVFPMKAWKAWNIKPWKTMESMENMEYKTMENHGKHGKHGI